MIMVKEEKVVVVIVSTTSYLVKPAASSVSPYFSPFLLLINVFGDCTRTDGLISFLSSSLILNTGQAIQRNHKLIRPQILF